MSDKTQWTYHFHAEARLALAIIGAAMLCGCASPTEPTEPMEIKVRMTYCNADRTVCRDTVMPR